MRTVRNVIKNILIRLGLKKENVVPDETPKAVGVPGAIVSGNPENIRIGKNVSLGGNVMLYGTAPIEIGDNTMVAINAVFHTSTHDHGLHPMWAKRIDRPIRIGKHVWIGIGAIILPGVIVEDYAVVGAGSVVTANVPKAAIVAGNPARIIAYRERQSYDREPLMDGFDKAGVAKMGYLEKYCKGK